MESDPRTHTLRGELSPTSYPLVFMCVQGTQSCLGVNVCACTGTMNKCMGLKREITEDRSCQEPGEAKGMRGCSRYCRVG